MSPPPILIAAAVERELEPLRALLQGTSLKERVRWVVTGVGKTSAAIRTTQALARAPTSALLQVGCAGAFPGTGLGLGDVVLATEEVLADEGAQTPSGFVGLEAIALPSWESASHTLFNEVPVTSPTAKEQEVLLAAAQGRFRVVAGRLATVSAVSGSPASAAAIEERWQPLAETLEGAATALAARAHDCPAFEFRGISNTVGHRDRETWDIDTACSHAALIARRFLELRCTPETTARNSLQEDTPDA